MTRNDEPATAADPADEIVARYLTETAAGTSARLGPVARMSLGRLAAAVSVIIGAYSVASAIANAAFGEPDIIRVTVTGCLPGPVVVVPAEVTIDSAEAMRDEIDQAAPGQWCDGLEPRVVRVG